MQESTTNQPETATGAANSALAEVPGSVLCAKCKTRPATVKWVGDGGVLAYAHGFYEEWCEVCATTEQLAYAKKQAANIPTLEAKLAELQAPNEKGEQR